MSASSAQTIAANDFEAVPAPVAQVNGVPLNDASEHLAPEELRQRACIELLRQEAMKSGLLDAADGTDATDATDATGFAPRDGVISEAASAAIEALLAQNIDSPEPSAEACRRHHAAHEATYRTGERVRARHILFAVTPGVDVVALRQRAEACLLDVRCHDGSASDEFVRSARELSNCPSGAEGGDLGWLEAADCATEFAKELFGQIEVGVLPRLVHSRFGLHVVEVLQREPGQPQPYAAVSGAVAMSLRQQSYVTALRQYVQVLAAGARITGVDLDAADTPLVQ
ncbi:MAG: peptidyl-prolyl cis-trans isomerase [Propionivibrio sp.]|uniref:peptidylprolyl isomerase n=1 Tax=Candidatus Propionivibrio dominans TaxID=2954373 RepID=A0A9D7I7H7_9RHOO|nr:peptidyl-prolyl cis-trans isomerase [Candidatus Propionivibrio dominans]MBK9395669.1 peptidyl-prolyl cis-trans isomerase [Uliginosibacterium sp.]MBL0166084.1 peptidyl-prolyl cis-trans isomerase [Propionivibrio sp.]